MPQRLSQPESKLLTDGSPIGKEQIKNRSSIQCALRVRRRGAESAPNRERALASNRVNEHEEISP
jgi:hypothetical protein